VVRESGEAYVVKQIPGSVAAEVKARLSAWKHRVIDRDPACQAATRRERIEHFHEAVRVWTQRGFGANAAQLVSSPEDDCIIYRYIEGTDLSDAVTCGQEGRYADTAPIKVVLEHTQKRHGAAVECNDAHEARRLLHPDPHQLNIILRDGVPVFVDLDDPLSERVPLGDLVARELAIFSKRVLRLIPEGRVLQTLSEMMLWYDAEDVWRRAADFLGRRRRVQLLGFAERRRRALTKLALSEEILARLG